MRLNDIKIETKLNGAFAMMALFVVVLGFVTWINLNGLMGNIADLTSNRVPSIQALLKLSQMETAILNAERSSMLANNAQELAFQLGREKKLWNDVDAQFKIYEPLPQTKEEADLWQRFKPVWQAWKTGHEQVMQIVGTNKAQARSLSYGVVRKNYLESMDLLAKIVAMNESYAKENKEDSTNHSRGLRYIILASSLLGMALAFAFALFFGSAITDPLKKGVAFARSLERGDLTARIDVDQKDEIGEFCTSLNDMAGNLRQMMRDLAENSSALSTSAGDLSSISLQLSSNAGGMSEKSHSVSAATEEMTVSMASVSAAAEQSSTNTNIVSSASEEMSATVGEIAHNTEKARQVASNAVSTVENASVQMNELGNASQAISRVIEVIVEIAEQTKLLALNATIEAARAGEAGKGFAVVANEVKELAKQTNTATEDIREKIEAMQHSTGNAISDIGGIERIIRNVDEIIASIASAVEEQSITTREIASNIHQTASGIASVTLSVTQAADVAKQVASDIVHVTAASNEVKSASNQISNSAAELSRMGDALKGIVRRFRV